MEELKDEYLLATAKKIAVAAKMHHGYSREEGEAYAATVTMKREIKENGISECTFHADDALYPCPKRSK